MNQNAATYYYHLVEHDNWVQQKADLRKTLTWICGNRTRILELDIAMWYGTIQKTPEPMKTFLKRMFTTIHYGGILYKSRANNNPWKPWAQMPGNPRPPLASTMSHGGRILIQLPKGITDSINFFNWLTNGITFESGIGQQFATHGVSKLGTPVALYNQRKKYVKEVSGTGVALSNVGNHKRKNVGIGGPGNRNPWTRNLIVSNGEHGQLYLYSWPPTKDSVGAIMLSLESEAPGKTGQTGHGHGAGATSEEFCATGGPKWKLNDKDAQKGFMEMPGSDIQERYDGAIIDLIGREDGREIIRIKTQAANFDMEWLVLDPELPLAMAGASLIINDSDPRWVKDSAHPNCARNGCNTKLTMGHRHHCRLCGEVFCDDCCPELADGVPNYNFTLLRPTKKTDIAVAGPLRVCGTCFTLRTGYAWERDSQRNTCARDNRPIAKGSRHHCRYCGKLFCDSCSNHTHGAPKMGYPGAVRICMACYARKGLFT